MGGCLDRKPVAWLDAAEPGSGIVAHAQLRAVLTNLGAVVVEAACIQLPRGCGKADNEATDTEAARLAAAMSSLAATVRRNHHVELPWM